MGRKAKKRSIAAIKRVAPTWTTPRFSVGDVLMVLNPETWRAGGQLGAYRASLYAAVAALIVCARATVTSAALLRLEDYRRDTLVQLNQRGHPYPIVLLPIAAAAIDDYLLERDRLGIGGDNLFVYEDGRPVASIMLHVAFDFLADRNGLYGRHIRQRLVEFFDEQFHGENRDYPAVIALRRGFKGKRDGPQLRDAVIQASGDRERLRTVLERNHVLAGSAGRWRGGHGRSKAAKTARLFLLPTKSGLISPLMRSDPVCARLLGLDWLENQKIQRASVIRNDLHHLVALLDEGKINTRQIAYLLALRHFHTKRIVNDLRHSRESPEQQEDRKARIAFWADRSVTLYRERLPAESNHDFFRRIVRDEGYPYGIAQLCSCLVRAGVLERVRPNSTGSARDGISEKVEKTGVAVRVKRA